MARFGQGLIQALTNPAYADKLNMAGMMAGSMPGRLRAEEAERLKKLQEEQQRQQQQAALMSAYSMAQQPGGSDPAAAMAAMTQGISGLQAQDMIAAATAGRAAASDATKGTAAQKRQQGIETVTQIASRSDVSNPNVQRAIQQVALNYGLTKEDLAMVMSPSSGMEGRDRYVTAGANIFDMQTGTWKTPPNEAEVSSMEAKDIARLYEKFTPSSVQDFIKDPTKPLDIIEDAPKTSSEMTAEQKTAKLLATDNTIEVIDNVLNRADDVFMRTYPLAKNIPGQPARALETDLATVRANLAFDRLQKMRDESKTGGALGQVSNIELKLLESAVAGLDPASPNFKENMERVRNSYDDFRRAIIGLPPSSDKYMKVGDSLYYKKEGKWFDLGAME